MSELKVNSIKGVGASVAALNINNTDGTCTANITNKPNRNLIINGAMQVAQRGTSTTTSGGFCVDRFQCFHGGTDEAPTFAQADVASGTTPYTLGFRKSLKVTNGNQTSGAGASDYVWFQNKYEAQDIANSGWNYTSSSSFITLSFWVKSSVAQNFYGYYETLDSPEYIYPFETGSLTADTWTKVTKVIPGNSNLVFNNDNGVGLNINLLPFFGTDFTDSGVSLNTWKAYASSARTPDYASTWYTTNDATFEFTGVQLEVGSFSSDFEFKSYGQELALCQRYYEEGMVSQQSYASQAMDVSVPAKYTITKRSTSTVSFTDTASGNMVATSNVTIHANRVDGAFSHTDTQGSGNYYYYYVYKASSEL